jgi:hypothetical protein
MKPLIYPVWDKDPLMLGRRNAYGEVVTVTEDVLDGLTASFKEAENQRSVISVLQYLVRSAKNPEERKDILTHMKLRGQIKALRDVIRGFGGRQASFSYREAYSWIMEPHKYKNINHVSVLQAMRKLAREGLLVKDADAQDKEGAYMVAGDIERRWAEARKRVTLDNIESLVLKTICVKRGLMLAGLFDGDVKDVVGGGGR